MSKSVEALENLLQDAKARVADIDRAIDANNKNLDSCKLQRVVVQSEVDDLQVSLSVLKGMKQGPFDPTRKNVK